MDTTEIIINLVDSLLESGIIIFFIYKLMKADFRYPFKFLSIPFAVFFAGLAALSLTNSEPWLKTLIILVMMLTVSATMFESKIRSIIFYCLLFIAFKVAADILPVSAIELMNTGIAEFELETGAGKLICLSCTRLFNFWFTVYITESLIHKTNEIPLKNWLLIIFVPLLSLVILNCIFVSSELLPRTSILYMISVIGIFILNIFVFFFFDSYSNSIKLQLMEQRLRSEAENYKLIEEKYTEIRQFKHDISNQLAAARRMFMQGSGPEAVAHLNRLYSKLHNAGGVCYTGISSVDAIVNMKWQKATSIKIPFSCKVLISDKMEIDELPLCRIIANLLDNAIEGVQRSVSKDKFIYISLTQNNNKLKICVMNSSDQVDTDDLATRKAGSGHGIGIKSVRESVNQLDGILSFNCEKGIFTADVMIAY